MQSFRCSRLLYSLIGLAGSLAIGCGAAPASGPDNTGPGGSGSPTDPSQPSADPTDPEGVGPAPGQSNGPSPSDGPQPGVGAPEDPSTPDPDAPPPPPPAAGVTECIDPELVGTTPIRRISTEEYSNAVRDVFGAVINPGQLPADEKLGTFKANVGTRLTDDHFERYRTLATGVSADVVANFSALSGCAATDDAACVTGYLDGAARRLFHGTLEQADQTRITDLYTTVAAEDANLAVETAVQWMLLSPRFLFLVEFGQEASATRAALTGSEIAGRLAAFFWRTVPDQALLALADQGSFDTVEGVRTQADAMLRDPRALPMLKSFGDQLLRIVPAAPGADALEQQKKAQVGEILAQASTDASLTFQDLILTEHPPSGTELANFYGDEDRRGILTTAGFLSSAATGELLSPVKVGYVIRTAMLCDRVPPPSDPVDMQLTDGMGGNNQEVFNAHSNIPECWGCHQLMDPIGDAFGQYTASGGFDANYTGKVAGTLTPGADGDPGAFDDLDGLLTLLGSDQKAQQCFALQASRFALGRNETRQDACGVEALTEAFAASSYSVRELLVNVATSTMFLNRNPVVAGGQCR